ncbi:unnamed protein product, partial [Effrenium voratum]
MGVLVEQAQLTFAMTVATSCEGAASSQLCRYVELELFSAPAVQIQLANQQQRIQYLQDNPRVNTDIDIQDIHWPWYSKDALVASPAVIDEVQNILSQ